MEISYFVQLLVVLAASVSADLDADFRYVIEEIFRPCCIASCVGC